MLGFNLGGGRRTSDKEEGRTLQSIGIAVVSMGERTFCVVATARVIGILGCKDCAWWERKLGRHERCDSEPWRVP